MAIVEKTDLNAGNIGELPPSDRNGHRKRLRERFCEGGIKALADYELIELLLTYSILRRDVKTQAKSLLRKFSSVSGLLSACPNDIASVKGLNKESAALISLVHAIHTKYFEEKMIGSNPLSAPEEVVNFSKVYLAEKSDENLMAVFVNSKNKVVGYEIISEGTVDAAVVYPRKIIRKTLDNNANGIILVHNHPSGDPAPSSDDISLTKAVKNAAASMDIRLLDHIIIGKNGYLSFLEKGML
jgi:DNA repair protein RadC